jgi:4-hydroxy-3-methylbut-2-en-1-yl diphosphate synthase IspG/GcpE
MTGTVSPSFPNSSYCDFLSQIAIMGCIVNGPGEMADADFGYVGGAP